MDENGFAEKESFVLTVKVSLFISNKNGTHHVDVFRLPDYWYLHYRGGRFHLESSTSSWSNRVYQQFNQRQFLIHPFKQDLMYKLIGLIENL